MLNWKCYFYENSGLKSSEIDLMLKNSLKKLTQWIMVQISHFPSHSNLKFWFLFQVCFTVILTNNLAFDDTIDLWSLHKSFRRPWLTRSWCYGVSDLATTLDLKGIKEHVASDHTFKNLRVFPSNSDPDMSVRPTQTRHRSDKTSLWPKIQKKNTWNLPISHQFWTQHFCETNSPMPNDQRARGTQRLRPKTVPTYRKIT